MSSSGIDLNKLGLNRYRWNPLGFWEINMAGAGWKQSNVYSSSGPTYLAPPKDQQVEYEATKHEPHWAAEATAVENKSHLTLEDEIAASLKRKTRSDKGKKRGKRA